VDAALSPHADEADALRVHRARQTESCSDSWQAAGAGRLTRGRRRDSLRRRLQEFATRGVGHAAYVIALQAR